MIAAPKALPAQIDEIERNGFTIARNVVERAQIERLKAALERAIAEDLDGWRGREYTGAHMVMNLMLRGEPFMHLLDNEVIHAFLTPLLTSTCILYAYTSSSMPPDGTNYSRRIHVDSPRVIPGYITNVGITLALTDFTDDNGAMELLPASFRMETTPTQAEFESAAQRAYPRAGDAIVFNARTWHRGGVNRTATYRHAVTMNVCRSYMRQQFDYPRMIGAETAAVLSERVRRFLGFDVRMPTSLDQYYVAPESRLYKANQG